MIEFLSLEDLKAFVEFAKDQRIPRLKVGEFECELPAKDLNQEALDLLRAEIEALKSICTRLSLQVNAKGVRDTAKPFTSRVTTNG